MPGLIGGGGNGGQKTAKLGVRISEGLLDV
jgi:hypothetical protein